jgi:GTP-binding protein
VSGSSKNPPAAKGARTKGAEAGTEPQIVEASFAAAASTPAQLLPPVSVEIAFAGRSNVGKSSLLNMLLGRKALARVGATPGVTRGVNFYKVVLGGGTQLSIADLPGYGYAKRAKAERVEWAELIDDYILSRVTLKVVVLIVDVRRGLEESDRSLLELTSQPPRVARPPLQIVVAATKLDKLGRAAQIPAVAAVAKAAGKPVIGFSSEDGSGRSELWRRLLQALELAPQ